MLQVMSPENLVKSLFYGLIHGAKLMGRPTDLKPINSYGITSVSFIGTRSNITYSNK